MEEIRELLDTKQYTRLRQKLSELNDADIAAVMEELEEIATDYLAEYLGKSFKSLEILETIL